MSAYDRPQLVRNYRLLVGCIQQADKVTLYKGVPLTWRNPDRLSPTEGFMVEDRFQFRLTPLPLQVDDAVRLTEMCCSRTYVSCSGLRPNCLFGENYGLEWRYGKAVSWMIFCFGCSLIYGTPPRSEFYFEMQREDEFKAILSQYG